jgi:hypothetical protein
MKADRTLAALGLAVSALAVLIQFPLGMGRMMAAGMSGPGAVVAFFSYFTILTNIFACFVYAAALWDARLPFFRRPAVRACAAVSIVVVGIVYHFLLAQLWAPQGIRYVTDLMLHYVAPVLMLAWWLACGRSGTLAWTDLPKMLVYLIVYLAYVLARAPIAGQVPYPFLDYWTSGWGAVVQTALGITALFLFLGALAIALDRHFANRLPDRTTA